jgi:hypothetical protein
MKTKLISFVLFLMLSIPMAMAQNIDGAKVSFAILGGVNIQNLVGKDADGDKLENDMVIGFHGGINIQLPVAPEFYFQPGLLFSTKGAKQTSGSVTLTHNISYIELPLNMVYSALLGSGKFMIGFGPYVAFAIGGKSIAEGGGVTLKSDIEFQNVVELTDPILTTYYKPLDAGANLFAGYEMAGGLFVLLNTQFGMLKINPENKWISGDESSIKNSGFGLSLGYRF